MMCWRNICSTQEMPTGAAQSQLGTGLGFSRHLVAFSGSQEDVCMCLPTTYDDIILAGNDVGISPSACGLKQQPRLCSASLILKLAVRNASFRV